MEQTSSVKWNHQCNPLEECLLSMLCVSVHPVDMSASVTSPPTATSADTVDTNHCVMSVMLAISMSWLTARMSSQRWCLHIYAWHMAWDDRRQIEKGLNVSSWHLASARDTSCQLAWCIGWFNDNKPGIYTSSEMLPWATGSCQR